MPTLYIVRGLPGSGKSTFARELQAKTGALFVEPDMFLTSDGKYNYTIMEWPKAEERAHRCLRVAVYGCADLIYADVLTRSASIEYLYSLAYPHPQPGFYKMKVFTLKITPEESKKRNVHNVRHMDIDRMAREWEDWPGEQVINGMVRNDTEGTEETEVNHG